MESKETSTNTRNGHQLIDLEAANLELEAEIKQIQMEINKLIEKSSRPGTSQGREIMDYDGDNNGNQSGYVSKFENDFIAKDLLGEGSIGSVFLAESRLDSCDYAVKRISVKGSEEVIGKVLDEIRAISQLDDKGIMRCHSTWVERPPQEWQREADVRLFEKLSLHDSQLNKNSRDGSVFIYVHMQLCIYSLKTWLEGNQLQSSRVLPRMKSWFEQMVSAVDYLHSKTLVHRNIKPSNILFIKENRVKVSDMGITTEFEGNERTELYRSPEHSQGKCTFKSDIFALGLIFAELCVVLTEYCKDKIFDNYRAGRQNKNHRIKPDVGRFVGLLTNVIDTERPSCGDILEHSFLNDRDMPEKRRHSTDESMASDVSVSDPEESNNKATTSENDPMKSIWDRLDKYNPISDDENAPRTAPLPMELWKEPMELPRIRREVVDSHDSRGEDEHEDNKHPERSDPEHLVTRKKKYARRTGEMRKIVPERVRDEDENRNLREILKILIEKIGEKESAKFENEMNVEQKKIFHEILQECSEHNPPKPPLQVDYDSKFLNEFTIFNILCQGGHDCIFGVTNKFDETKYAVRRIAVSNEKTDSTMQVFRKMSELSHPGIIRYYSMWIERPPDGWQHDADVRMLHNIISDTDTNWYPTYRSDSSFIYIQTQIWSSSLDGWIRGIRKESLRDLTRIKSWFKQIVSAVEYLHDNGFIHRDLKPSNIVFTDKDCLKICDMGIMVEQQLEDGIETESEHDICCTPLYTSPEQRSFISLISSKADIFTLGLIFTELIIVLSDEKRVEIFDNFRHGKANEIFHDSETAEFVRSLTHVDPKDRPTCREILNHPFLSK